MIRKAGYFRRYPVGLRNRNGFEFEIYQLGNDCYYRRFGIRTYRLLNRKQAYSSIDWVTIFLFAGMMPVSTAMDKTGAGKLIANWAVGLMGGEPTPLIVTIVLFPSPAS